MGMAAMFDMCLGPFEQAFVPLSQGGSTWNVASIGLVAIEEKKFKNIGSERFGTKVSQWPWPLVLIKLHVLI